MLTYQLGITIVSPNYCCEIYVVPSRDEACDCRKTIYLQNTFWSKTNINQSYYTKQLLKVFDRSSMCFYHITFLYAKSEVLNVNVT